MLAFAGANGEYRAQIYVANIDGADVRQVTRDPTQAYAPRWSPDGAKIVYEGGGVIDSKIFVLDLATGKTTQVARGSGHELSQPNFSPDGRTILFTSSSANGNLLELRTVPANGGRSTFLLRRAADGSYSPDGTTIAYTTGVMWLADADGSDPRQLARGTFTSTDSIGTLGIGWRPTWLDDDTLIVEEYGK